MANYKYKATTFTDEEVEGTVQAPNQNAALVELKKQYAVVSSVKQVRDESILDKDIFGNKIDEKNLSLVCQQLSIILNAGLPVTLAIKLVADQTEDKNLKTLLTNVADDVKGGSSLASAFEKRDERLPSTFIEPIRAAEVSGSMDKTFEKLSSYFTNKSDVAEKVKSALIYPAIVIALGIVVIIVIMVVAVPMFKDTFAELGSELPFPTRALIAVSDFTRDWIWLIILVGAIFAAAYFVYRASEEGRYKTDQWKLRTPILGKVRLMSAASEFANSFSTMITSGLPVIKALRISAKSLSNYSIGKDVIEATKLVEGGYKISDSLKKTTVLPDLLIEVVGIGERTGSLEKSLGVIGTYYDKEARTSTDNAIKILEPAIILVLAVFVVFILLAVYLPMFSMYSQM